MSDRICLSRRLTADYTANPNRSSAVHRHICKLCVYIQNVLVHACTVLNACVCFHKYQHELNLYKNSVATQLSYFHVCVSGL